MAKRKKIKTKVCIVSNELKGPTLNGGIGTFVYWLSRELAAENIDVTVLFTGTTGTGTEGEWVREFRAMGVTLEYLESKSKVHEPLDGPEFFQTSFKVFQYLKGKKFQSIHFQDWKAHGYHTLLARRSLGEFAKTLLTVTLHSSTQWLDEAMRAWPDDPVENAKLRYCEALCAETCDVVVSPSRYMIDYVKQIGWKLPADTRVIPNPYERKAKRRVARPASGTIAFFGRLETRKGIVLLFDALAMLKPRVRSHIKTLLFIGKDGSVGSWSGTDYIARRSAELNLPAECLTSQTPKEAIATLRKRRAVVLCPSLVDNFPYVLVECGMEGLPVVASNSGGAREIVGEKSLVEPTASGWAKRLDGMLKGTISFEPSRYSPYKAVEGWKRVVEEVKVTPQPPRNRGGREKPRAVKKVSICVPYFNAAAFVGDLMKSLKALTYKNLEFILVDDQSTDLASRNRFDALASTSDKRFRFLRMPENGGAGAARNFAVSVADGEYLVFVDADNIPMPDSVDRLVRALEYSNSDAVTCYFLAFEDGVHRKGGQAHSSWSYMPMGPSLQLGCVQNVFGDTNFIIRRDVFQRLGGWRSERGFGWADWQLLATLVLRGFKLSIVPEFLLMYRSREGSLRSEISDTENHRLFLRAFNENTPPWVSSLINDIVAPLFYQRRRNRSWIMEAERDGYLPELEFVADFLKNSRLGKFIRSSEETKSLIEEVARRL